MSKLNLSEAAAQILQTSVNNSHKDKFGPGYRQSVKTPGQSEVMDIDTAGYKSTDNNYDFTKGVPTATPPGQTPPTGSEPMKKLKPQPQETEGRKDIASSPEDLDPESKEEISDRKSSKKAKAATEPKPKSCTSNCKEDIDAMLAGESLSEEFKERASMIFEAAVNAKVEERLSEIEDQYIQESLEVVEAYKEGLSNKLDSYLDYVVESWMEENKLAVEMGLKTQIAEDFMEALRNVFVEHYIDIPEEKVNVVEELIVKVENLEEQVNSEILKNIELKKIISEQKKIDAINGICEGLTLSQAEKLKSIAKSIEFNSENEFNSKLMEIKESYYPTNMTKQSYDTLNEEIKVEDTAEVVVDPLIASYVSKIAKLSKF